MHLPVNQGWIMLELCWTNQLLCELSLHHCPVVPNQFFTTSESDLWHSSLLLNQCVLQLNQELNLGLAQLSQYIYQWIRAESLLSSAGPILFYVNWVYIIVQYCWTTLFTNESDLCQISQLLNQCVLQMNQEPNLGLAQLNQCITSVSGLNHCWALLNQSFYVQQVNIMVPPMHLPVN